MIQKTFQFEDTVRLTSPIGASASTLREFLVAIESVETAVLHHHLRETPLRFPNQGSPYPNDFALWASRALEDRGLAERLSVLDPFHEKDLEVLRERVAEAVELSLDEARFSRNVPPGQDFYFARSLAVRISLGVTAETIPQLLEGLRKIPCSSIYHHVYGARLRHEDGKDDLSHWLAAPAGRPDLAARLDDLDIYLLSLENCRTVLLELLDGTEETRP